MTASGFQTPKFRISNDPKKSWSPQKWHTVSVLLPPIPSSQAINLTHGMGPLHAYSGQRQRYGSDSGPSATLWPPLLRRTTCTQTFSIRRPRPPVPSPARSCGSSSTKHASSVGPNMLREGHCRSRPSPHTRRQATPGSVTLRHGNPGSFPATTAGR